MTTPPGVSPAVFDQALRRFGEVVGKDWLFTAPEDVDLYKDAYSPWFGEERERVASAAVAPDSVEQVQAVMRIANELAIPVYPISTGKNLTYGGSAPVLSGSVVLDLKRMNRILEVSEKNAFALVEPGVSYFDLYRHIREHKLKLWIDCPDPGWGSPLGNALDHGAGRTALPYRDHFEAHCGMEVVLADGDLVRTGMGALPGSKTWQQFRNGMGPIVDGLFAQSNFGVVTKMGFWLMPEPEAALTVTVAAPRHDDVARFTEILATLYYAGIVPSQMGIISPVLMSQDPELTALRLKPGGASAAELDRWAQAHKMMFWTSQFTFYGPDKVNRAQWEHVRERFSAIDGISFSEDGGFRFPLSDDQIGKLTDRAVFGIPSLILFTSRQKPGDKPLEGHMDFSPVVPIDGETILEALEVFNRIFAEAGVVPLGGVPQFYHTRAMTIIYAVPTGRDPETNRRSRETFSKLIDAAAQRGWGEYRVHPAMMEQAVGVYSFNDHALRRLHETLKDAIDPKGIISAGRYGIWPKSLRQGRGRA